MPSSAGAGLDNSLANLQTAHPKAFGRFSRKVFVVLFVFGLGACIFPVSLTAFAFSNGQSANIVLGQSSFTTSTQATSATGLNLPRGLAFDSSGNLWVADTSHNRVLEYKAPFSNGEAATTVIGQSSFTTSTQATSATGLNLPRGLAFDSSGNLWVADTSHNRVLEYKAPFSNGEAATTVIGQSSFTNDTEATSATGLDLPESIAFDSSGNLWVADTGNVRILEYKAPFSNGEAATTVIGQPSFTTAGLFLSAEGLGHPRSLAFDSSGNLWVVDGANNRVLEYKAPFSNSESATTVIGESSFTAFYIDLSATGFGLPRGLAFDSSGNLWVADSLYNRILEYKAPFSNGEAATTVIGQSSFTTSTQATSATGLNLPRSLAFDSSGNLWVADTGNVRVLEFASTASTPSLERSSPLSSQSTVIPSWIKNNAKWWSTGQVGDNDFVKGIQYLIQQGVMTIPQTQTGSGGSQQIPAWVKTNAGWWANGQISDGDFVKGIQYLVSNGIIQVS